MDNFTEHKHNNSPLSFFGGFIFCLLFIVGLAIIVLRPLSSDVNYLSLLFKISNIVSLVEDNSLYTSEDGTTEDSIVSGVVSGLLPNDIYAYYYPAPDYTEQVQTVTGSYVGIGVTLQNTDNGVTVAFVNNDGPAKEADVRPGDTIIEVDGESTQDVSEATTLIQGPEGTSCVLTILREGEEREVRVERRTIAIHTVHSTTIEYGGTSYGYISISSFNEQTDEEFEEAFTDDWAGIVIDLRNNGGGELLTCLSIVDRILDDKLSPIVTTPTDENQASGNTLLLQLEGRDGVGEVWRSEDGKSIDIPIVILVNGNSASASEIFAGILHDYGYRTIGTNTYGKGVVQTTYAFADGSGLQLTTNIYRLPGGEIIDSHSGLTPDFYEDFVPYDGISIDYLNYTYGDYGIDLEKDNQIQKCLSVLTTGQ